MGDCLFRSLVASSGIEMSPLQLRKQLVAHMRTHRDRYEEHALHASNVGNYEKYLQDMSHPTTMGDYTVLAAAADHFGWKIRLRFPTERDRVHEFAGQGRLCGKTVRIYYVPGHYEPEK